MSYVDGVLIPVPTANKDAYIDHARTVSKTFKKLGALSLVECWGDDIPEGKTNSLHTAVLRKPDETVVFSWILWPSKEVRDAAWKAFMEDPEMRMQDMPFDGARMIFGGFDVVVDG